MEDKKINIGIFCDSFYPMIDGVVLVIDNYAKRLSKVANVFLFVPGFKGEYDDSKFNYTVVRSKSMGVFFLDYPMAFPKISESYKKVLKEHPLDIVHVHSPFAIGKYGIDYAKKHNIPSIITLHSQHKRDFLENSHSRIITHILLKKIVKTINKADYAYAVNQKMSELYIDYGVKKMPGVLLNASDMAPLEDLSIVEKLRLDYKLTDEVVLLFLGRIDITKNIFFTASVLKKLKEKKFNFKMFFVGSGQKLDKLKKTISEYGLNDKVIFTGRITDREMIKAYFKMAHLMVFPSDYDASSLVQIEAASQKTPTIFAKDSITSSTIIPEVNGYEAELDEDIFSDKIISIFSDLDKYNEVSQKAFDDVFITWDQKIEEVYQIYLDKISDFKNKK